MRRLRAINTSLLDIIPRGLGSDKISQAHLDAPKKWGRLRFPLIIIVSIVTRMIRRATQKNRPRTMMSVMRYLYVLIFQCNYTALRNFLIQPICTALALILPMYMQTDSLTYFTRTPLRSIPPSIAHKPPENILPG